MYKREQGLQVPGRTALRPTLRLAVSDAFLPASLRGAQSDNNVEGLQARVAAARMLHSYRAIVTASGHMREEYLKQGFSLKRSTHSATG